MIPSAFLISLIHFLVASSGTNAPFSYNRFLAKFIAKRYAEKADIEVREIDDIKPFCRTEEPDEANVNQLKNKKDTRNKEVLEAGSNISDAFKNINNDKKQLQNFNTK